MSLTLISLINFCYVKRYSIHTPNDCILILQFKLIFHLIITGICIRCSIREGLNLPWANISTKMFGGHLFIAYLFTKIRKFQSFRERTWLETGRNNKIPCYTLQNIIKSEFHIENINRYRQIFSSKLSLHSNHLKSLFIILSVWVIFHWILANFG